MPKSKHYWQIHAKVTKRAWLDLPVKAREAIANDTDQDSELFKWFQNKVNTDSERLYLDPEYYYNQIGVFDSTKRHETLIR